MGTSWGGALPRACRCGLLGKLPFFSRRAGLRRAVGHQREAQHCERVVSWAAPGQPASSRGQLSGTLRLTAGKPSAFRTIRSSQPSPTSPCTSHSRSRALIPAQRRREPTRVPTWQSRQLSRLSRFTTHAGKPSLALVRAATLPSPLRCSSTTATMAPPSTPRASRHSARRVSDIHSSSPSSGWRQQDLGCALRVAGR